MGFKYQGDATLGVSLTMQTPKPLDSRQVVNTRADLYTIPPQTAYNGMAVVCVSDGNIYTLLDKNKIGEAVGWKASYESIQIIPCTQAEYTLWKNNTNDDFSPKDETATWLHEDTYYYIYEDSIENIEEQSYVSYSQLSELSDRVYKNAQNLSSTNTNVAELKTNFETSTTEINEKLTNISENYATLEDINSENSESKLSKTLSNYYTQTQTDDKFVTKDSLRGDGIEGDNFVFVTQSSYNADKEALENTLNNKVDTNSDAVLKSITTGTNKLVVGDKVTLNDNPLALEEDVPKIVVLDQQEYDDLATKDPDVYYMTHGTEENNGGMVTSEFLETNYYSQKQVIELIKNVITQLCGTNNLTFDYVYGIEIEKPTSQSYPYDGEVHELSSTDDYDVVGTGGSEPGTYRFKVILKAGKWWKDGTNTPIFVTYVIQDKFSKFGDSFPIKLS